MNEHFKLMHELLPGLPGVKLVRKILESSGTKIEADYKVVREDYTEADLEAHFHGKKAIGISPFLEDGESCKWLLIDIDRYGISEQELYLQLNFRLHKDLVRHLVPAKTKSGGWHLFLFLDKPVKAKSACEIAGKIRAWLAGGPLNLDWQKTPPDIEIRPLQWKINPANSDTGSFATLPLFNTTEQERELWFKTAFEKRASIKQLNALLNEGVFTDGPCCLFPAAQERFNQGWGLRNEYLFQTAIFFKKQFPAEWEQRVEEWNDTNITPALLPQEVNSICESVKKGYRYICNKDPFKVVCNKKLCEKRKFGISRDNETTELSTEGVILLETDPPVWFITVKTSSGDYRVKVSAEDLLSAQKFKKRCIEASFTLPNLPKQKEWEEAIAKILDSATKVPVPVDMTEEQKLFDHIGCFFSCSPTTTIPKEVLNKKIYMESDETGTYAYFRYVDLSNYLDRMRIKLRSGNLYSELKELEMKGHFQVAVVRLEGLDIDVWRVPVPDHWLVITMEDHEK